MRNRRRLKSFCRGTAHIPDFHRFFGLRASYSKNDVLQKFKHFTAKKRVFCVKNPLFCKILEKSSISLKTERTANNFPLKTGKYRQKRLHSLQNYHTSDLQTGWTDKISGNQKNVKSSKNAQKGKKQRIFIKFPAFSANQQVFRRILSGQNRIASVCPTAQKKQKTTPRNHLPSTKQAIAL